MADEAGQAIQAVPRDLWNVIGAKHLHKSLKIRDLHVASASSTPRLRSSPPRFDRARKPAEADNLTTAPMGWRETLAAFTRGDGSAFGVGPGYGPDDDTLDAKRFVAQSVLEE